MTKDRIRVKANERNAETRYDEYPHMITCLGSPARLYLMAVIENVLGEPHH